MDYRQKTKEELLERIQELEMLNRELLAEKIREDRLDYAWAGNLGHWYFNIVTGNVVFNPLKVECLGFRMEEIEEPVSYRFFTDRVHPDDLEPTMQAMRDNMAGLKEVYECEYRIQAKDGSWKWFYDRGKMTQRDDAGKPLFAAGIVFDITDQKEQEDRMRKENRILEAESRTDSLTGIRNRSAIMEELALRMEQTGNCRTPLSIAMFDIDHFKNLNDTYGHVTGDYVLKEIASVISDNIRGLDFVGRYGGEEFLAIFPNTGIENARTVCERIRASIEAHPFREGIQVTISGGLAAYECETITEFIDRADKKLYESKNSGRNRIRV